MNKHISDEIWCSLSSYAEAMTDQIIMSDKLPSDIRKEEIKSEVYNQFGYLISNYKPGKRSLTSYCWEYAPKRVINELWKDYSELNNSKHEAYEEFDNGEDYEEHHQYGKYEKDPYLGIVSYLETKDLLENIEKEAISQDFTKILTMMKNGMTEREIAMILDMSQSTLHRKIESFRNALIEKGIKK